MANKSNSCRVYLETKIITLQDPPKKNLNHIPKGSFTTDKELEESILKVVDLYFSEYCIINEKVKQSFANEVFTMFQEKCDDTFKFACTKSFTKLCKKFEIVPRIDLEIFLFPNGTYKIHNLA